MKTLITNVHLLTMDEDYHEVDQAYILIEDQDIVAYGAMADLTAEADYIVDGQSAIALPGMINTHTHLGMVPFRSLGDDTPDRLTRFLFPLEHECMTEALTYHSSKYAIAEMQLAGISTFFDMYYFEDVVAQATDEMQARAILGESVIDKSPDSEQEFGGLTYGKEFIPKWLGHDRIIPAVAPHAPYTNTDESLQAAHQLAQEYSVPLSIHLSEMTFEMDRYKEQANQTPVEYLASLGVLNNKTLAAHCIYLTDSDIEIMKQYDVAVAHCIGANTKSAKGVAPLTKMLEAGLRVGLGTDGPSSGNTLDLFTQMRMVANFHKTYTEDRSAFPAREIVRLATLGGAQALGLDSIIGSIEVGKKADICLIETDSVNMFPIYDAYSAIVYSANTSNVQHLFINGQHIVMNRELTTSSLLELRHNLKQEMIHFQQRAIELANEL